MSDTDHRTRRERAGDIAAAVGFILPRLVLGGAALYLVLFADPATIGRFVGAYASSFPPLPDMPAPDDAFLAFCAGVTFTSLLVMWVVRR